eukprot:10301180-Prorocentrum_lima.AAC.1
MEDLPAEKVAEYTWNKARGSDMVALDPLKQDEKFPCADADDTMNLSHSHGSYAKGQTNLDATPE